MKKTVAMHRKWWRRSEQGQSLVEFAAGVVVLVIIVSGVLDLGRAFFTFVAIENGAGEGAIYASYHPTWVVPDDSLPVVGATRATFENITWRAKNESPSGLVDTDLMTVLVEHPPTLQTGEHVTVTVTYSYTVMTAFLHILVDGGLLPLRAEAAQVIVNVD
jgi:Flp pilus assembly protein TadG